MFQLPAFSRWRAALTLAGRQVLTARWRTTLAALESARAEYGRLRSAALTDVRAVRKAAQRVQELEQLRMVLARELLVIQ